MTFKAWYEESTKTNNRVFTAQEFYEAGQQSKQAEIDALQKRIDGVVKSLEGVKSTGFRPHCYDYDKGWRDCAITTLNDLKGDKND